MGEIRREREKLGGWRLVGGISGILAFLAAPESSR